MVTSVIKGGSGTISLNVSLFYRLITRGGLFDQKRGNFKQRGLVAVQASFEKDWVLRLFSAEFNSHSSILE